MRHRHITVHLHPGLERATVFDHGGTVPVVYEVDDAETVERIESHLDAILDEAR